MEQTATTVQSLLTDVGTIVTNAFDWAGTAIDFVVDNPLVLIFAIIPLVGLGVGMLKRVMN